MAPLDRAIALAQMYAVAVLIEEDLYLDVARTLEEALQDQSIVTERGSCLAPGGSQRIGEPGEVADHTHALATSTGSRLDEQRRRKSLGGSGECFVRLVWIVIARQDWNIERRCKPACPGFVAHSANGVRRGANPANARPTDCLREVSVLGQESVPRMQGIGTRRPCECDHGGAVEQVKGGFGFMSADAGDAHTGCRAADARRNLAPIGNEQRPDAEGAERACASSRLTSDRVQRVTRDAPTARPAGVSR